MARTNSPWGKGPRSGNHGGGGNNPPPQPPSPPNLDDLFRKGQERFQTMFEGGSGNPKGGLLLVAAALVLWLASGIYKVDTDEQGLILRFGEFHRLSMPGLNYHLPAPIETVDKVKVTTINRVEVGYRGTAPRRMGDEARQQSVTEESLMLTGDENIIDVNFQVQWKVEDAVKFRFNVRSPELTVKPAAESAMREVIGRTIITGDLAEGRSKIERETKTLLQEILHAYGAGIQVVGLQLQKVDPPAEVIEAFRDVQTAKLDQERMRNEAEAYRNDIIPRARGQAERMLQESQAYREEVVARARGEAARFMSVYREYQVARDVTRKRMYLETMEEILRGMSKVVVDTNAKGANGVVPFLPLSELTRKPATKGQ